MKSVRLLAAALVLVSAAACSGSGDRPAPTGSAAPPQPEVSPPAPADPIVPTESAVPGGLPTLGGPRVHLDSLARPWGLALLPDGDVVVSESDSGRILRVSSTGGSEVLTTLPVDPEGEGGLLGLAFDPSFEHLYAYLTTPEDNRVVRMTWDGSRLGPPGVVVSGLAAARFHNGGRLAFGPDGMLYVGTGDAGVPSHSQDPDSLNGKVLRLMPDGSVPPDNPVPGNPLYTLGHRNVQGLAFDSAGRLWASEFGQDRIDEVNLLSPGGNYGWPEVEGAAGVDGYVDPLVEWTPEEASPSGVGIVDDVLYVAALRGERIWQVELRGDSVGEVRPFFEGVLGRVRLVTPTGDGALWVLTSNTPDGGDPVDVLVRVPIVR